MSPRHLPALLGAVFLCLLGSGTFAQEGTSRQQGSITISDVSLRSFPQGDVILVRTGAPIQRRHECTLRDPKRFAVDLYGCTYGESRRFTKQKGTYIKSLRVGNHPGKVRIAANLPEKEELKLHVKMEENGLAIYVLKVSTALIEDIRAGATSEQSLEVLVSTADRKTISPRPTRLVQPNQLVVDLPRTFPAMSLAREIRPDGIDGVAVRVAADQDCTRLVLDMGTRPIPKFQLSDTPEGLLFSCRFPKSSQVQASLQGAEVLDSSGNVVRNESKDSFLAGQPQSTSSVFQSEAENLVEGHTAQVNAEPSGQPLDEPETVAGTVEPGAKPVGEEPAGGASEQVPWETEKKGEEPGAAEKSERFKMYGKLWNKLTLDLDANDEFESDLSNHAEVKLGARYVPDEKLRVVASVRADSFAYRNESHWDTDSDFMLDETYLNWAARTFNLNVGNQVVRWGKADELSPLDNLNPEALKDGLVRPREERKLPTPMVNAEIYGDPLKFQGVFIPYFEKSKFDRVGTDWALFRHLNEEIGPISIDQEKPSKSLENCLAGARVSGTIRRFDFGFSYLYGRDHLPSLGSLSLPPFAPPVPSSSNLKDLYQFARLTGQPVTLHYDRQSIYGFEFETVLGDVGVRGDLAFVDERRFLTNELENVKKRVLQYVVGGDYHGPESIYVNLQFSQTWILDYDDSILFEKELTNTLYGKVSKGFSGDRLNLTLRSFYNLTDKSYFFNPALELKYWEYFDFEIGVDVLGGSQNTALGWFGDNDQAYLILRAYL